MAQKCVHKGCGKVFTDPEEPCTYHPGPPEFHEGQKGSPNTRQLTISSTLTRLLGWKCCKPRFLTFDEFLAIPPCTTGKHSTVDDTPGPALQPEPAGDRPATKPIAVSPTSAANGDPPSTNLSAPSTRPLASAFTSEHQRSPSPAPAALESDSDDPSTPIPAKASCKRRACGKSYDPTNTPRADEECVYHPGSPLFHEGSKGWTCCKRRVLEFDQFMKIEGCKRRQGHLYAGKKKLKTADEEKVEAVRNDFYQTSSSVIVSFYLKKIDKAKAKVEFPDDETLSLDLPTTDGRRYTAEIPLWAAVEREKCESKIMGTKLEVVLVKKAGEEARGWPTLRSDERATGEIIQTGRAGRA